MACPDKSIECHGALFSFLDSFSALVRWSPIGGQQKLLKNNQCFVNQS